MLSIYNAVLFRLDHLPRHLHQFMRGSQCPLTHFAEHLREFEQTRFAIEPLDTCQRAITLDQFLHLVVLIAKRRQLRKMCHTEHLMRAREIP